MKTTSNKPTQSDLFQPLYVAAKDTEQIDRERLRFGSITNAVIKKLENPAISMASRNRENPTTDRPTESASYVGPIPKGEVETWHDERKTKRETGRKVVDRKGKVKNKHGKAWLELSHHDREDIHQAIAMVLCKYQLLSDSGFVMGEIPDAVWLDIFKEARKACRINKRKERSAVSLDHGDDETGDFLQVEAMDDRYLTRDRTAIARYARMYRNALRQSRDLEKSTGNRKWKSNYKRYRAFLTASLRVTLRGDGWGGLVPDEEDSTKSHNFREKSKIAFRNYVLQGLKAIDPDFFAAADIEAKETETVFRDLADLPSFLEIVGKN